MQALLADTSQIRQDLEYMTRRWHELDAPAVFEVRCFKEGTPQPKTFKYAPDWIDEAVETVEEMNALGYNCYVVRNPIRADIAGSAKDEDIIAAFFLWADCDDGDAADNVKRFDGPKCSASIVTGRQPSVRAHIYWELAEPCTDLAKWREMQVSISRHFGSDGSVINPSRIMRIAGTVAYPAKHKVERGYQKELSRHKTYDRAAVTMDQMQRAFGASQSTSTSEKTLENFDQFETLDRERTRIQALSGQEWHNAVVRLVASYVSKGLSDDEIHSLTAPLTLTGYTVQQTRAEVQVAIDGARAKGWTPEEYANPAAIKAPEAQDLDKPVKGAGLEWFEDISPSLTDSYLIKGVLAQEAMSVVYGPSNSGKTFFALDMAYHLAVGAEWRGRRVTQCAVLYLAAEGGRGVLNRIAALKKHYGQQSVPLALKRAGMDLLHEQADLQHVCDLAAEVKSQAPGAPLLIVIDTLSRVMAGGDENSPADMTAFIRNIDAIRTLTGAHIMVVHHTGKDTARGARGHSSLRAATDTEIEVQNSESEEGEQFRAAMVTKQRDYQGGETFAFVFRSVPLGFDQDGDEVTSCVVEPADAAEFAAAKKAKKGLGGVQKLIAETFDQMLGEGLGRPNPGGVGMPESGQFWAVDMAELKRLARGKMTSSDTRSSFNKAFAALSEERGIFCTGENLVWRVDRRIKK